MNFQKIFMKLGTKTKNIEMSVSGAPQLGQNTIKWFNEANIKIVDIGARGNSLPDFDLIAPYSHICACEPDVEEAVRLNAILKDKWKNATIFSEALYTRSDTVPLYVTDRKGLSSLLEPNLAIVNRYYPYPNPYVVANVIDVNTMPLDQAAIEYDFSDASFIKIDTQGTELDILMSGQNLLANSIVGIHVEVELHQFYKNQFLFSDIDKYLRTLGFSLFDLEKRFVRRSSFDQELYSRRQAVWGNALYLKEPPVIIERQQGGSAHIKLKQLFAVSLVFEFFDLALEIVNQIDDVCSGDVAEETKQYVRQITTNYVNLEGVSILRHGAKEKKSHG